VKALLETIARGLVEEPAAVHVHQDDDDGVVCLELEVAEDDRGRVLGQRGRMADALRTLLDAAARRRGVEVDLEVL
jgi:predicted RNA-binding protein YlqC (UPF0109 family)